MTAPTLTYNCEQAAERIGAAVSSDWLKRHARAGDIPHTRAGKGRGRAGRLAFTEAHLAEILLIIEQRPDTLPAPDPAPGEFTSVVSRGKRSA